MHYHRAVVVSQTLLHFKYSIILNVLNSLDNKLLTPTFSAWTAWACPRGSGGATHEIKRGERKAALQVIFFGG